MSDRFSPQAAQIYFLISLWVKDNTANTLFCNTNYPREGCAELLSEMLQYFNVVGLGIPGYTSDIFSSQIGGEPAGGELPYTYYSCAHMC